MTLLSKIKTLISYAKFGMFFCNSYNGVKSELHFPRAIKQYRANWNAGWNAQATKLTGYVRDIGGTGFLDNGKSITEIDLPECTHLYITGIGGLANDETNTILKIVKLPSLRIMPYCVFKNMTALEYLELGAVTSFD